MQKIAHDLGSTRLTRENFFRRSGMARAEYEKYFDSWTDACCAAGLQTGWTIDNLAKKAFSREDCLIELHRVAELLGRTDISSKTFSKHARFTSKVIFRQFGTWKDAMAAAGLELTNKSKMDSAPPTKDECISEMQRIARLLGQTYLTIDMYNKHANINSQRVSKTFGSWRIALAASGLSLSPQYKREIPIGDLATNFLAVVEELNKIPTLVQLVRRTKPVSHTYAGRFGGYDKFKQKSIISLLASNRSLSKHIRTILERELERINQGRLFEKEETVIPTPHHQGMTLNFRAFAYAPTSEHDVVQMFGAVAHELGFEIIGNRSAFPDCESRRRKGGDREHYVKCLIEYEFSSKDYKKHGHPQRGCDLVVCWIHDWIECPIEVLELSAEIRKLDGWR